MKLIKSLRKAQVSALALVGAATLATSFDANAIPPFARQTGFKCVACHVGGMFPQLTSLGRMFKLTGYTLGNRPNLGDLVVNQDFPPVAIMVQGSKQYYNNNKAQQNGAAPNSAFDDQVVSLFAGGKITDNVGAFLQWTQQKYSSGQTNTQWTSGGAQDNSEIRYADRLVGPNSDLIYGVYVNNRPTMSDVWNTTENWVSGWINFFNGGNAQAPVTFLDQDTMQHLAVGTGAYVFKDKTWYGEIGAYKSVTHGALSFATAGNASGLYGAANLIDTSPYFRFAYNKEWGPHEFEIGLHGMVAYAHNALAVGAGGDGVTTNWGGSVNTYRDVGIDSQYQYILDPHYFAAHFRISHENSYYNSSNLLFTPSATAPLNNQLTETYLDGTYIYEAKYGAMLTYQGATGNANSGLYAMSGTFSPNWQSVTPHIFYQPWQNVRIGYMYQIYTQMGGASQGLTFNGIGNLKPADFNTSMLYVGMLY